MSAEKVIVRKAAIADLELLLELSTGLLEHDANFDATLDKKALPLTSAKLQQTNASQLACRRLATR